jgi:double-strand break repair protein MRE11
VLVRLKVDHTGFPALNNQRFGARFVGQVANPTDILLFHKRKKVEERYVGPRGLVRQGDRRIEGLVSTRLT